MGRILGAIGEILSVLWKALPFLVVFYLLFLIFRNVSKVLREDKKFSLEFLLKVFGFVFSDIIIHVKSFFTYFIKKGKEINKMRGGLNDQGQRRVDEGVGRTHRKDSEPVEAEFREVR